jgi:hypothetical protein
VHVLARESAMLLVARVLELGLGRHMNSLFRIIGEAGSLAKASHKLQATCYNHKLNARFSRLCLEACRLKLEAM